MSKNKNKNQRKQNITKKAENKGVYTIVAIILAITFFAFLPSLSCGFVSWDDEGYIVNNLRNIGDFSVGGIANLFTKLSIMGNYHPLTMICYSAIYKLFQLNPTPYHFFNLLLHLANTFLVFLFIYRLTDKRVLVAAVCSLLFGIHPLHVESVTWISETKDVLYTFFYLLAIQKYLTFREDRTVRKHYFYALLFFVLSCLSKGMAVTLPIVLLGIIFFDLKKAKVSEIFNVVPFFIISLIFGMIALKAQQVSEGVISLDNYSTIDKILFPFYSAAFYIIKMIVPINLSIIYPYPEKQGFFLPVAFYFAPILILFLASTFFMNIDERLGDKLTFGIFFYFFVILPVIQIKPVGEAIAADRYFYVASIGLFYLVGELVEYLFIRFQIQLPYRVLQVSQNSQKQSFTSPKPIYKPIILSVLAFVFVSLFVLTFQRTQVWKDSGTLWASVIESNPKIDKAYYGVGIFLERKNKKEEAVTYYQKALSVNPRNVKALNNLGNYFYTKLMLDSAANLYSKTIEINPKFSEGYYNLGNIAYARNDMNKAIELYEKSFELDNKFLDCLRMLVTCYEKVGNKEKKAFYRNKLTELNRYRIGKVK